MSLIHSWGIRPEEKVMHFPCDDMDFKYDPSCTLYRGITINANPDIIYKWLSQMRIAAYSYDFIDGLGKKSPQKLLPDQPLLAVGQTVMEGFEVIKSETDKHITLKIKQNTKYPVISVIVCYFILPIKKFKCRLLVKGYMKYKPGLLGYISKILLPWGDLIMMRKQLINFKHLAEKTADTSSEKQKQ